MLCKCTKSEHRIHIVRHKAQQRQALYLQSTCTYVSEPQNHKKNPEIVLFCVCYCVVLHFMTNLSSKFQTI